MTSTNVVQFSAAASAASAASQKRDRDHIAAEQEENHVIHDSGGGPPPIVVNMTLKLPDGVFEENKSEKVQMTPKKGVMYWLTLICTFWLGFSLFS